MFFVEFYLYMFYVKDQIIKNMDFKRTSEQGLYKLHGNVQGKPASPKTHKLLFVTTHHDRSCMPFSLVYLDSWTYSMFSNTSDKYFLSVVDDNTSFYMAS